MILYGIGMLPLTLQLKAAVPAALQPWYADAAGGDFYEITRVFSLLLTTGPGRGYFPKLTKSILVMKPTMVDQSKARFNHIGFQVTTGTRHLGSFVGTLVDESSHIRTKVGEWSTGITCLSSIAQSSPQAAFYAFQ